MAHFTSLLHLTLVFEDNIVPLKKLTQNGFYSDVLFTQLKSVTLVFMKSPDAIDLKFFKKIEFRKVQCP